MNEAFALVKGIQSEINTTAAATSTMLIGNKGGGKGVLDVLCMQVAAQVAPDIKRFANTRITNTLYVPDILQWLSMKLIEEDETPIEASVDEAAISGLEARGSYTEARALDSYLLMLSRKVNVNNRVQSQLKSMVERRAQWTTEFSILSEVVYYEDSKLPHHFEYNVYDENLEWLTDFQIDGDDARQSIYPLFKTGEIPFIQRLSRDFRMYYNISDRLLDVYDEVMGIQRPKHEQPTNLTEWHSKKALRSKYDKVLMNGKHYAVDSRDWDVNASDYRYFLREIA